MIEVECMLLEELLEDVEPLINFKSISRHQHEWGHNLVEPLLVLEFAAIAKPNQSSVQQFLFFGGDLGAAGAVHVHPNCVLASILEWATHNLFCAGEGLAQREYSLSHREHALPRRTI